MTTKPIIAVATAVVLAVSTAGCETVEKQLGNIGDKGYLLSCAGGAVIGAVIGVVAGAKRDPKKLAVAAAAGCAVGLAATAVGKALNERQRAKHEESVQRTAKRQAKELEAYGQTQKRYEQMPKPASEKEKLERDRQRERELAEIKRRYEEPDVQDLGDGASSTVSPVFPDKAPEGEQVACFDQNVSVNTPSGRATQVQTVCPKKDTGEYVRAEVRQGAA